MLEFRADGTYDEAINPHRKHDCEANGCNTQPTNTPPTQNPVLTSLPIVGDILALSDELTDDDIERIGESPLFDASLRGTYVGDTNRILK